MFLSRLKLAASLLPAILICVPAFAEGGGTTGGFLPGDTDSVVWLTQEVTPANITAASAAAAVMAPHAGLEPNTFGHAVAVSGDFAVIGDPSVTVAGNAGQGAAFVFKRENGVWKDVANLTANDGAAGDGFGIGVAINAATIVVGAYKKEISGNQTQGAAYVFERQKDGSWKQTAKLVASDGMAEDYFGFSVAVSGQLALIGSGAYRIVGGPDHYRSSAYAFTRGDDGNWTQTAKLQSDDSYWNDHFSYSLALNGNTALIGAYGWLLGKGAAYIFTQGSTGEWTQTAKLMANDGAFFNDFGHTVALDGNTAVVGAYNADVDGVPAQGSAYVFARTGGAWAQSAKLVAEDGGPFDDFGQTVAVSGDTVLVSSQYADAQNDNYHGAAYVFSHAGGSWAQTEKFMANDGAFNDAFGIGLGIDGHSVLIGSDKYAAYFYAPAQVSLAVSAPETVGQGQNYVSQSIVTNSASATSPAVALTMTIPAAASFISANASQGSCMAPKAGSASVPAAITSARTVVSCNFGGIEGNAGTATANVTFKALGSKRARILNTATIANATPALTAALATTIVNNPPVAQDGSLTTRANKAASGVLEASDPDNDPLTFKIVRQPRYGKVTLADPASGKYTYTPDKGYRGADSFTFEASDGEDDSNVATILIAVKDNAPVAKNGTLKTRKNKAASGALEASDPDGDKLTFIILGKPKHGTVTLNNPASGAFTYTPDKGYTGADAFTFKASDGTADSNAAAMKISIANGVPVAKDGTLTADSGASARGQLKASDPDGDPLTYSVVSKPKHGSVQITNPGYGNYTYTANSGYSGSDSFTFKVNDGADDSNVATIAITVNATSHPPHGGGSGGGGGFGGLGLLALAGLALVGLLRKKWRG
jgi:VCBS repeat-containing protein